MSRTALCTVLVAFAAQSQTANAATFTLYDDRSAFEAAIENQRNEDFTGLGGQSFKGTPLAAGEVTITGPANPDFSDAGVITDEFDLFEAALISADFGQPTSLSFGSTTAFGADFASLRTEFDATAIVVDGESVGPLQILGEVQSYNGFFGFTSDTAFTSLSFLDSTDDSSSDRFVVDNLSLGDALPTSGGPDDPDDPDDPVDPTPPDLPYTVYTDREAFEAALKDVQKVDFNTAEQDVNFAPGSKDFDLFEVETSGSVGGVFSDPVETVDGSPLLELFLEADLFSQDSANFIFDDLVVGFGADIVRLNTELGGTILNFLDQTIVFEENPADGDGTFSGFFGIISDDPFSSVNFFNSVASNDLIGFDNVTLGTMRTHDPQVIPLPASGLLLLGGFGALALVRRREFGVPRRRPA
ncbi:MAG: VPLPA-CTERM sorting domain-containing protein [Pseudomonadota bacterium]